MPRWKHRYAPHSQERLQIVDRLRRQNWSYRGIGRVLGVSGTVAGEDVIFVQILKRQGWNPEDDRIPLETDLGAVWSAALKAVDGDTFKIDLSRLGERPRGRPRHKPYSGSYEDLGDVEINP